MSGRVLLCDATLCDGPRTLVASLPESTRLDFVTELDRCGVGEVFLVSPDRIEEDVRFSRRVKAEGLGLTLSGQVRASSSNLASDVGRTTEVLDRIDLLMPLSPRLPPVGGAKKISQLVDALDLTRSKSSQVGVTLLYASEASPLFLLEIVQRAVRAGAQRITLEDTAGESEPFALRSMLEELMAEVRVPVFYRASDRLGLAVANSWAAVLAGARGLIVSVGGLRQGDSGGSLERVAELLARNRFVTGVETTGLGKLGALIGA